MTRDTMMMTRDISCTARVWDTDTLWGWWNVLKKDREIKTRATSVPRSRVAPTRVFTLDNERGEMRAIFDARLLFALGIIRFVLRLSDNKHLILLFPVWPWCAYWHVIPGHMAGVTSDNVMITPGSWQIFDRVVSISYHHPDNEPDVPTDIR